MEFTTLDHEKADEIIIRDHNEFGMFKNKKRTIEILKALYVKGYRYVVRDTESVYLSCYNAKPKRYMDYECWGYKDVDLNKKDTLPAAIIKNNDMQEINFSNKSATPIDKLIYFKEEK